MKTDFLLKDFFNEVENFKQNGPKTQESDGSIHYLYPTEFLQIGAILLYEEYKTNPGLFSFTQDYISYANEGRDFTLSKERFLSVTGKEKESLLLLFVNPETLAKEEPTEEVQMTETEKEQALEIKRLREALENANKRQDTTQTDHIIANSPKPQSPVSPKPKTLKRQPEISEEILDDEAADDDFNDDFVSAPESKRIVSADLENKEIMDDKMSNDNNNFVSVSEPEKATPTDQTNSEQMSPPLFKEASITQDLFSLLGTTPTQPLNETPKDDVIDDDNPFKKPKSSFLFNEHEVTFVKKENGFEQNGKLYVFPLDGRKQEQLGSRIFAILDMKGLLRHGMSTESMASVTFEYNYSDYVVRGSFKENKFSTNIGTTSKNVKEIRQQITAHDGKGKNAFPIISIEGQKYYVFPHGMTNNKNTGLTTITMFCEDTGKVYLCDDLQNICIEGKEKFINVKGHWTKDFFHIDIE